MDTESKGTVITTDHSHLVAEFAMEVPYTLLRWRVAASVVSFLGRRIMLSEVPWLSVYSCPLSNPWRDCHGEWHKLKFNGVRTLWFEKQEQKGLAITPQYSNSSTSSQQVTDSSLDSSTSSSVSPKSWSWEAKGLCKRRGAYRARLNASSW